MLFFAISGVDSVATYLAGGLLNGPVVVLAAVDAPVYGLGLWLGSRVFDVTSEAKFRQICLMLIALAALIGLPIWH